MSQQKAMQKTRKKSCCQKTCLFLPYISQIKIDHKSFRRSKRNVQNKSWQKHVSPRTSGDTWDPSLPKGPSFSSRCPAFWRPQVVPLMFTGVVLSNQINQRDLKGPGPVCAIASKITKRKGTLQSALPVEKGTAWGRSSLQLLHNYVL